MHSRIFFIIKNKMVPKYLTNKFRNNFEKKTPMLNAMFCRGLAEYGLFLEIVKSCIS